MEVGGVGWGWWAARGGLCLAIGLFGASMSPISASYRLRQAWKAYKTSH